MTIVCRTCVDDVVSLSTYYICRQCEDGLKERIAKLEKVSEAAREILPFIPEGDTFGANKHLEHNWKAKALRDALNGLDR